TTPYISTLSLHDALPIYAEFSGLPLHRAREAVLDRINEERLLYDALLARAMKLAQSTFADVFDDSAIYVDGAASLLGDAHGLTRSEEHTSELQSPYDLVC